LLAPETVARFYAPGAPIPDGTFADALTIDQGTDRIRLRVPASADGPVDVGSGLFFDTRLGQTCAALTAADGSRRCLPAGVRDVELDGSFYPDLFADAACTAPLASYLPPFDECAAMATPVAASIKQPRVGEGLGIMCKLQDRYRAYRVVGPHTGPVYEQGPGGCVQNYNVADWTLLYDLGEELRPDALASIDVSEHYPPW
jgi:hypothetical protein